MEEVIHRLQCAAITNGCMSAYLWTDSSRSIEIGPSVKRRLELSGWWLDHGFWVCGIHERGGAGDVLE